MPRLVHVLFHLARADFLERVRSYGFLLTLGFAAWLGWLGYTGDLRIDVGNYRGVFNAAWIGALISMATAPFLTLVGFYVVKNAVDRDRRTGVGEILAATPLRKLEYVTGKAVSNFGVLAAMVAVLAVAGLVMFVVRREAAHLDWGALLLPSVLVSLPAMALTASAAVFFEVTPGLRGGFGNVLYFVLWGTLLGVTVQKQIDFAGFGLFLPSMMAAARAAHPDLATGFTVSIGPNSPILGTFPWSGLTWTQEIVGQRLAWLAPALALVAAAAVPFDRFDPSRRWWPGRVKAPSQEKAPVRVRPWSSGLPELLERIERALPGSFARLVIAELRLALRSVPAWWPLIALGLLVASFLAPLEVSRRYLWPCAWLWPLVVWSGLGAREIRHGTGALILSAPRPLARQLLAVWLAGFVVALVTGAGMLSRLMASGDFAGVLAWLAGALFVPSFALAAGVWSGSGKLFEASYTALWYVGPLHSLPVLDFLGTTPETARGAGTVLLAAVALGALAVVGRIRRLEA
jgi:hypothetical protein